MSSLEVLNIAIFLMLYGIFVLIPRGLTILKTKNTMFLWGYRQQETLSLKLLFNLDFVPASALGFDKMAACKAGGIYDRSLRDKLPW